MLRFIQNCRQKRRPSVNKKKRRSRFNNKSNNSECIAASDQPRNLIKVKENVKFNLLFLLSFVAVSGCLLRFCCTSAEVFAPWLDISHKKNEVKKSKKKSNKWRRGCKISCFYFRNWLHQPSPVRYNESENARAIVASVISRLLSRPQYHYL